MRRVRRFLSLFRHSEEATPAITEASSAPALVRAAEIAFDDGRTREAIAFYGRALDIYLALGDYVQAERTCQKIIAAEPGVIRTHYTLAAIAVARGQIREAQRFIGEYTQAVRAAHAERMAMPSLLGLAAATAGASIRKSIADALLEIGHQELADGITRGTVAPAVENSWRRAVSAALTRPEEVNVRALVT